MLQVGEILGFGFQGRLQRERGATTSLLELLTEKMDTAADRMVRRKSLTERLGLKGISCCGATWGLIRSNNISVRDDDDDEEVRRGAQEPEIEIIDFGQTTPENEPTPPECVSQIPTASGMNLAAALAAERHLRAAQDSYENRADSSPNPERPDIPGINHGTAVTEPGTPFRVSLMKLLQETDGCDGVIEKEGGGAGCDLMCCVCMVRKKGAAFIPCGHTFCRVCSRELWLNRGFCPLCNRSIIEILDIF